MKARRLVYWALWPVEQVVVALEGMWRLTMFLVIASNPVFLALWLMRRRKRERERQEH